jgi:hypothetical protein
MCRAVVSTASGRQSIRSRTAWTTGEQLLRRDLLELGDEPRGLRHEGRVGLRQRLLRAEHDKVLRADRHEEGVRRPVGADDPRRLGRVESGGPAGAEDARGKWLALERQVHDAHPAGATAAAADEAQPRRGHAEDQLVVPRCHLDRHLREVRRVND